MTQGKLIKILLVEDNPHDARFFFEMLKDSGLKGHFTIDMAPTLSDASKRLAARRFDVVLLDIMLPDSTGLETFTSLQPVRPDVPIVLLTGLSDENMAASAVRQGAQDYLVKGQVDPNMLVRSIRYAIERRSSEGRGRQAHKPGAADLCNLSPEMVGVSRAISEVRSLVDTVSKTSGTSVLITGETGTGKELVANAIHYQGSRREGPFIKLNCSAIPDTLMEAELFGYEKGAFTDARQSKKGLFELADGGTIFLDEIVEMDLRLQPKLLRILENRTLRKLGGVEDLRVDVRVIAASNVDLQAMVRERRFREDLFYRLNVMAVVIPPLRERREDIEPLALHFIQEARGAAARLSQDCVEMLLDYPWPGNVRELKNVIERALIFAGEGEIRAAHLQLKPPPSAASPALPAPSAPAYRADMSLEELERAHIANVLGKTGGNITHASKILGISRFTLREKIKRYGIRE